MAASRRRPDVHGSADRALDLHGVDDDLPDLALYSVSYKATFLNIYYTQRRTSNPISLVFLVAMM